MQVFIIGMEPNGTLLPIQQLPEIIGRLQETAVPVHQLILLGTTDAKDFVVRTNNVERMHILGATVGSSQVGWIGMGIATTPKSALDVAGNYSGKNVITIQNTSSTGFSSVDMLDNSGNLATTFGFANSGTGAAFSGKAYLNGYGNDFLFTRGSSYDLIMKGSNGYVGLNTSTPSERLHVVGNIYLNGAFMPGR